MKIKIVFLFLLLCLSLQLNAQQVIGVIFDESSNEPLASVIITNKRTEASTTSDINGKYNLSVKYGDTISVILLGYKSVDFVIKDAGRAEVYRNIYLIPQYGYLDEVVVTQLSPYQKDSIARRDLYGNILAREGEWVSGVGAVFSPVTAVAQLVNKKAKQRRKFQGNFYKWEHERFIESRYTTELVAQVTKLKGDSLYYFIKTYPIEGDFARAATDIELKMWIRYNLLDWQAKPADKRVGTNVIIEE